MWIHQHLDRCWIFFRVIFSKVYMFCNRWLYGKLSQIKYNDIRFALVMDLRVMINNFVYLPACCANLGARKGYPLGCNHSGYRLRYVVGRNTNLTEKYQLKFSCNLRHMKSSSRDATYSRKNVSWSKVITCYRMSWYK